MIDVGERKLRQRNAAAPQPEQQWREQTSIKQYWESPPYNKCRCQVLYIHKETRVQSYICIHICAYMSVACVFYGDMFVYTLKAISAQLTTSKWLRKSPSNMPPYAAVTCLSNIKTKRKWIPTNIKIKFITKSFVSF